MARLIPFPRRRAFSFIELLIVIGIVGVAMGLMASYLMIVREKEARAESLSKLKNLSLSLHNCNDIHKKLPPAVGWFPGDPVADYDGRTTPARHGTAQYFLLPFLEEDRVFNTTPGFSRSSPAVVGVFLASGDPSLPSDGRLRSGRGATSYATNWFAFKGDGKGGATVSIPRSFEPDGISNTVAFVERYSVCDGVGHAWGEDGQGAGPGASPFAPTWWGGLRHMPNFSPWHPGSNGADLLPLPQFAPGSGECNSNLVQGFSRKGIHVGLADGSSRLVGPKISKEVWTSVFTPDAGDPPGSWED